MFKIILELMYVFFMIGLFTIGGGYAMIPMIKEQVVSRGWMSMDDLTNFIAIAESTPGPFAVNTATLVGFTRLKEFGLPFQILGGALTTISVVLPSFIIILIIASILHNFIKYKGVKWALNGIKPVVVGLILAVVYSLIKKYVFEISDNNDHNIKSVDLYALGIMLFIFSLKMVYKKLSPIWMIIISGFIGFMIYFLLPNYIVPFFQGIF